MDISNFETLKVLDHILTGWLDLLCSKNMYHTLLERLVVRWQHPSGGKRAKNRFIRGDASDKLSSGDVL